MQGVSLLLAAVYIFIFSLIVFLKNKSSVVNIAFFWFGFSIFLWLLFFGLACFFQSVELKLYLFKVGYIGIVFIPVAFNIFVLKFLNKRNPLLVGISFVLAIAFIVLNSSGNLFINGVYKYNWGYYPKAAFPCHFLFLFFFLSLFTYAIVKLGIYSFISKENISALQRAKIKYIFLGCLFGVMGVIDYFPNYGINVYPFGFIFMIAYPLILVYAIVKYRLLDISLVFTRTGIFIFVYSFVLGLPFAMGLGWKQYLISWLAEWWWLAPLISSTILATAGPFIYLFIQNKAENRLLKDQKRYQATLKQASSGMTRIKDLKKLLNLIVYILSRTINLEHACIYLYDFNKGDYLLKAARGKSLNSFNVIVKKHSNFIRYVEKVKVPIVYEEIKQKMQDYGGQEYKEVEEALRDLQAEVVVPIFTEKKLIAMGVLGKKKSRDMYSQDDLAVFVILANQVALAIENAQFYEESKKTQAQLFQAEKMATIGTMADGLSHQINNRLHALGFIAGDALDSIKLKAQDANKSSAEIKNLLCDVTGALLKIQENVRQGGEIVQGLLRYTRKGEEGFGKVDFDNLVDASIEMAQFKIKKDQLVIVKDYDKKISVVNGNFTQLQEVMFNIIDNAYDAIMQRKTEKKEKDYKGKIQISTRKIGSLLEISILDNGIGIKEEDQNKLFTPFFTTKLSSRKGTGLGLYVIRKIIEDNHGGKVFMSSEYMIGTLTIIKLPVFNK